MAKRRGMSLLELVVATSLLAMMLTAVTVILRTSRQVWESHEAEFVRLEAAQATLRHIVRQVRQADAVSAISDATDNSGQLALAMPDGQVVVWDHDGGTNTVNYGVGAANSLLAPEIAGLRFAGLRADGTTPAAQPAEVQCLRIDVTIPVPAGAAGSGVFSSWAWIRSW